MLQLTLTMMGVAAGVGIVTLTGLYQAAQAEERLRLQNLVQSQARLVEAVARFDAVESTDFQGGGGAATLSQVLDAHRSLDGFGDTGEFVVGRLDAGQIHFLSHDLPNVSFTGSNVAEPMRNALSGESGTVMAYDYAGEVVLAAYEPVAVLDVGLVAKIDLAELRAP